MTIKPLVKLLHIGKQAEKKVSLYEEINTHVSIINVNIDRSTGDFLKVKK